MKKEKLFAKPFISALDGHSDSVMVLKRHPTRLTTMVSGSADGEVRIWDLAHGTALWALPQAHYGFIRGLGLAPSGNILVSSGDDKTVKVWKLALDVYGGGQDAGTALSSFTAPSPVRELDHSVKGTTFATCGDGMHVWDTTRSEPLSHHVWGPEAVVSVRWSPVEPNIVATTGSGRSLVLYDVRASTPIRKVVLAARGNCLAWNPQEAVHFTVGSEDSNCYTFDMRNMDRARTIHKDHVSAVMSIDYAPTGREFVTGGYDRMVRLFPFNGMKSRDVYHTKRMQRVYTVQFSGDAKYVASGSDDTNVRLWKANASEKIGVQGPRQRAATAYENTLKDRFKALPEIKRIARHHHVPKAIFKARKLRETMEAAERRRQENRLSHMAPEKRKRKSVRNKAVIKEFE